MGYKLVKFGVVPGENEQIDAIIKVPKEPRSVIHGVVLNECNKPIKDAVVKLLREHRCDPNRLEPITHTFTDEHGQFLFGPLCAGIKYVVKVWVNNVKTREIVIKPDSCEEGWTKETSIDCQSDGKIEKHEQDYIQDTSYLYDDEEE